MVPSRVIFHHSLSKDVSAKTIARWHKKKGWSDIGYHFVVREDGTIEQGRDMHKLGAHAKGKNRGSIGICFTGDFSKRYPTELQYLKAAQLFKSLCIVYCKKLTIDYHHDLCPGTNFDRDYFERWT